MNKKIIILSLMLAGFLFFGKLSAQQTTIYEVKPDGTGDYATIQEAVDWVTISGDTRIYIYPGTYDEQILIENRQFLGGDFPLKVMKAPGTTGDVVIQPSEYSSPYILRVDTCSNIEFHGIKFMDNSALTEPNDFKLVHSVNSEQITFDACSFTARENSSAAGLEIELGSGTSTVFSLDVRNSEFNFTKYGIAGNIQTDAIDFSLDVINNSFNNFINAGIYWNASGYPATSISFSAEGNTFYDSEQYDSTDPYKSAISFTNARTIGLDIAKNKIVMQAQDNKRAIYLDDCNLNGTTSISNNMISSMNNSGLNTSEGIYIGNGYGNVELFYNTVWMQDPSSESEALSLSTLNTSSITSFNNIWKSTNGLAMYCSAGSFFSQSDNNIYSSNAADGNLIGVGANFYTSIDQYQTENPDYDFFSFESDVQFVSGEDLHLAEDYNEAESRGDDLSEIYYIYEDFDGQDRLSTPDIGADECERIHYWTGDISSNIVWNGTVYVNSTVTVEASASLTIGRNAKIYFSAGDTLIINGDIFTDAYYPDERITLTAQDENEPWAGIVYNKTGGDIQVPGTIQYCDILYAKKPTANGGAITIQTGNLSIENSSFKYCEAQNGGAVSVSDEAIAVINKCLFKSNTASNDGGAVYYNSFTQMQNASGFFNNILTENTAGNTGGALSITGNSDLQFAHNTFYNNAANGYGHEAALHEFSGTLYNTAFWNDNESSELILISSTSPPTLNGVALNGSANDLITGTYSGSSVIHNIAVNGFKNPENLDFKLSPESELINIGYNMYDLIGFSEPLSYDFNGSPRPVPDGMYDIGATEFGLYADAGSDASICADSHQLNAQIPTGTGDYNGQWSVAEGTGTFQYPGGNYTMVYDISPGTNKYVWTLTDGEFSVSDTVVITNLQPQVNAGEDIFVQADTYGGAFPDTQLNAEAPGTGVEIYWQITASPAGANTTLSPTSAINPTLSGIEYGFYELLLTAEADGCTNSDSLVLAAGYSIVSDATGGTLNWTDPNDWDVGAIPGEADSVTIYNCTMNIGSDANGVSDQLVIGNGGSVLMEGTAKGPSGLTVNKLFIAQTAEKFPGVKGAAELRVNSNATLNISADSRGGGSRSAMFVGGGGSIFLQQTAEKSERSAATINVAAGADVYVSDIYNNGTNAEIRIGDGGYMNLGNTRSADLNRGGKSDMFIGGGGSIFLQQTAEKAGRIAGGELRIAGSLFIAQDAEKGGIASMNVRGGSLFIQQTAEKAHGNSRAVIGYGGGLLIAQDAEKATVAEVSVPELYITGGKVVVGGHSSGSGGGELVYGSIFLQQEAEKALASDTALIVRPYGTLTFDETLAETNNEIEIGSGTAAHFAEGATINTMSGFSTVSIQLDKGSSFIDMNESNSLEARIYRNYITGEQVWESFPINGLDSWSFWGDYNFERWSEAENQVVAESDFFDIMPGNVYGITAVGSNSSEELWGTVTTGTVQTELTTDLYGMNLIGNPYPSAIDWELMDIPAGVSPANYIYNPETENFRVYMQGEYEINRGNRYIPTGGSFFVLAQNPAQFSFDNTNRVHYFNTGTQETPLQTASMRLSLSDGTTNDECLIYNDIEASENYELNKDALKLFGENPISLSIYTASIAEDYPLAISGISEPSESSVIPLYADIYTTGSYTINAEGVTGFSSLEPYIVDLADDSEYYISETPSFTFSHDVVNGNTHSFEIRFREPAELENPEKDIQVYANNNVLHINNSGYDKLKISIYDVSGKLLKAETVFSGHTNIPLEFAKGLYIVKIKNADLNIDKKIVLR